MSAGYALLVALIICAFAAALEGACAGSNVKPFFATLKFPRYSAPLWIWYIIGIGYYATFLFILYRIFRLNTDSALKTVTLGSVLISQIRTLP